MPRTAPAPLLARLTIVAPLTVIAPLTIIATPPLAAQPAAQPGKFFDTVDTNRDGAMSLAEWKASGRDPRGFQLMDTNGDGRVTRAEGQAFMQKMMSGGRAAN